MFHQIGHDVYQAGIRLVRIPSKRTEAFVASFQTMLTFDLAGLWAGLAAVLFLSQGRLDHIGAIVQAHWSFFPQLKNLRHKRREAAQRVADCRIQAENTQGRYSRSIAMDYYGRRKRHFKEL